MGTWRWLQVLRLLIQLSKTKQKIFRWRYDPSNKHRIFVEASNGDHKAMIRKAGWTAYYSNWIESELTPPPPPTIPSHRSVEVWLQEIFPRLGGLADLRHLSKGIKSKKPRSSSACRR